MIFDGKPAVVGHRGFGAGQSGGPHENTMPAYRAAAAHGLPWIELDVQRSQDGQLVIAHDPVTADGAFLVTRTADELAAAGILRFEDVLAELPADLAINVDVKTILQDALDPLPERTGALLAAVLRRHAGQRRLLVTSFDPGLVVYLRDEALPEVALGLITLENFPSGHAIPAAVALGLSVVSLHTSTLGLRPDRPPRPGRGPDEVIGAAHRAGLEVLAWSPGPADSARLAAAGVDAVCVDDAPGVLATLGYLTHPHLTRP
jgi:glycerophosphoryl diester phosphodiesterase